MEKYKVVLEIDVPGDAKADSTSYMIQQFGESIEFSSGEDAVSDVVTDAFTGLNETMSDACSEQWALRGVTVERTS